jgi:tRNA(fMet)-specific endonuclease VapC
VTLPRSPADYARTNWIAAFPRPNWILLIASTALVHDLTLVTHNVQDFANVLGLRVVDWLAP